MSGKKVLATNRKARHEYFIEETYECGIELKGTEVKSIRQGKVNLTDGFASVDNSEVFLKQVHISPYEQGNRFNVDPLRVRKLLLHKKEIKKLEQAITLKGYTLVPVKLYFVNNKLKVSLGVCRGKKDYDKRESIKERDIKREVQKNLKNY